MSSGKATGRQLTTSAEAAKRGEKLSVDDAVIWTYKERSEALGVDDSVIWTYKKE